ncbi:hypothetical protein [Pedobacter sp. SYSU D00535]|uniref:hypothetical protein n=1 Tax=Pedobacter sp. SYSU D00535 TaxID=2810308 RepID=UPI001A961F78|nr:hypothetical protein [Pedobacter sp. SYSU D00535]
MKVLSLIVFVLFSCRIHSYAQQGAQNTMSLYVRTGFIQQTTHDQLLNYHNYAGNAVPINLYAWYVKSKNFITLNLHYQAARLEPVDLTDNYYAYNYIQHRDTELALEYFREIARPGNYLQAYIGIQSSSHLTLQRQDYKSLLYGDSDEFRKSYAISALSFSPALLINLSLQKNDLTFKAGHSLLHYAARPDENYVKQTGLDSKMNWKVYGLKEYKNTFFAAVYKYEISRGFGVMAEYAATYRRYSADSEYKYLRFSYLVGVGKTF